ncbi:MAG: YcxB family protein [Pirellulaceae bacterium]
MMTGEYTLRFSPALLRSAVIGFWWRTVGIRYLLALAAVSLCVGYLVWQGDRSWLIGLLGAVLIFGGLIPAAFFWTQYRQAFAKLRGMKSPEARLAVSDAGLTVSSDLARSEIPWSAVTAVWRFPMFWLLVFSRSQFLTIPLESVPLDVRDRIMSGVEKAGGKVLGQLSDAADSRYNR